MEVGGDAAGERVYAYSEKEADGENKKWSDVVAVALPEPAKDDEECMREDDDADCEDTGRSRGFCMEKDDE